MLKKHLGLDPYQKLAFAYPLYKIVASKQILFYFIRNKKG